MVREQVLGRLRALVARDDPEIIYECRRCGRTLDTEVESCPSCEADAIERFVI